MKLCWLGFHKYSKWEYREENYQRGFGADYIYRKYMIKKIQKEFRSRVCEHCGNKQEQFVDEKELGNWE